MEYEKNDDNFAYIRNFYSEVNKCRNAIDEMKSAYDINLQDIELLLYIIDHEPIERRLIIEREIVHNPVLSLKKLYQKNLIKKKRPTGDERTVIVSINSNRLEDINQLLVSAEKIIREHDINFSSDYLSVSEKNKMPRSFF